MILHTFRTIAWLIIGLSLSLGQLVSVDPVNPTADDTVTITFDAREGNAALQGHAGPVYLHTGVIIGSPESPSGWRYVQGEWGTDDARMRTTRIGPDRYQFRMHIRSFYGIAQDEPFLQLGLVFRSQNGSLVAKDVGDKDIFYPQIEVLPHGPIEKADAADAQYLGEAVKIFSRRDGSIFASDGQASLVLRSYGPEIIQVSYSPLPDQGSPAPSEAVVLGSQLVSGSLIDQGAYMAVSWGADYEVRLQKKPLRLSVWKAGEQVLADQGGPWLDRLDPKIGPTVGLSLALQPGERLYGTGSRALPIDRRGQRLYHYNQPSYGYTLGEDDVYLSLPVVLSSQGYGIFADSYRKGYFDLGQTQTDRMEWGFKDSTLRYFIILGESPARLLQNYTQLTGRQPLPPKWAMGYIQSRFGYRSQAETQSIVRRTIKAGFPLDATLLDLYWFGDKSLMGNLDWAPEAWPDPDAMIEKLDSQGVETILITETYVTEASRNFETVKAQNLLGTDTSGQPFVIPDFWAGSAGILDVTNPAAVQWMWPFYQRQLDKGVAGFWCDSGEPENHPLGMRHAMGSAEDVHNVYSNIWARDLYRAYRQRDSVGRWFNLIRSGYAGMQRYATFPWSGDVSRSWDAFRAQPMIMLGAGLCGIGYMHSDLGGFTGGPRDPELFQRWLQMGTFVPVMRVHGDATGFAPEPIFYEEETQDIARKAIKLRYQLLPYNYTLAWENHMTGAPLARPMWFHFPADSICARLDDQYMWGSDLLIAPVFEKGATERQVYLPAGEWYQQFGGPLIEGAQWISVPVTAAEIPVFVRAGRIIPMVGQIQNTKAYDGRQWTWHVYPTSKLEATGRRYLDDSQTQAAAQSAFQLAHARMSVQGKRGVLEITATGPGFAEMPATQDLQFIIHDPNRAIRRIKGAKVQNEGSGQVWEGRLNWTGKKKRIKFLKTSQD